MSLNNSNVITPVKIEISRNEKFYLWTGKSGSNAHVKILLLHGGPGSIHDYMECFGSNLPEYECCYYDQLGSGQSDKPVLRPDLWTLDRFVEEVEQVRQAFGLDQSNFYLCGHSWGGVLAQEYALRYQQHLKGLIISNMVSNIPANNEYYKAHPEIQEEEQKDPVKFITDYYCSENPLKWPALAITLYPATVNMDVYITMQGSSLVLTTGNLATWDISDRLGEITVPTLFISGERDAMDNKQIAEAAGKVKNGQYWSSAGCHFCMYDDQQNYFNRVREFVESNERRAALA